MSKATFYHSFKVIDTSLRSSTSYVSFSVDKSLPSSRWCDNVGRSISSSFETDHNKCVSDLKRQFDYLERLDKQLPSSDAFDYQSRRSTILAQIDSCRVGG